MTDIREQIRLEARRIQDESFYYAEVHFAAKTPWINLNLSLGLPAAILAAIAGVAAFSQFANSNIIAGSISIIVSAVTAILTFLDPNRRASAHTSAGKAYQTLGNSARAFHEIESLMNYSEQELMEKLQVLITKRDELNLNSPTAPRKAYRVADERIEKGKGEAILRATPNNSLNRSAN